MKHIYQAKEGAEYTLVLLHGTGGDEYSLLPLAERIEAQTNLLSLRGDVNENGYLRFFRRKAEGVYDLDDLEERTLALGEFIKEAAEEYSFDASKVILLGFSNGANIALHLLFHKNYTFNLGVLLSPLYPLDLDQKLDLTGHKYFISMGTMDPICPMEENQLLLRKLDDKKADYILVWGEGHSVSQHILNELTDWLGRIAAE